MLATLAKTLYTTSASCIIIFVYRLLLLSESIYISKGCEAPCPCSFLKSQYLFLFSYYQPVEQVLVFRASGV